MTAYVLTVAQQKGGAGKTTIAAQIAVAFSRQGRRVALIDIDPQGSLAGWHRLRRETLDKNDILLSDVSGWRLGNELTRLKKTNDILIIDTPPHAETEAKAAVRAADLVIVPIQPSPMDLWASGPTLDLVRSERRPLLVVMNRVPPRGRLAVQVRETLAAEGLPLAEAALGNRTGYAATMMDGLGVAERRGNKTAVTEVESLTVEIAQRLAGQEKAA